ncbi:hypothetical protein JTE90_023674 [Oedothorax gibbosus]|uniref:Protein maelstrom homolog n=1 Tax=Oedothorax gibbosus TaxID=931172 RepID=A0AAV6U695_9ARAC|nr:hypothetical protein JTE90_023674 [Oedothorax gibbosus]
MPNKNKNKNPFYFFMVEMKEKEAAKGRTVTMKTLPNLAHPIWAKMSVVEREPYEEMARRYKNDPNLRGGKLMSDGERVEDYLRADEEIQMKEKRMKSDIRILLNINNCDEAQFKDEAQRKVFYFISFNILCKTGDPGSGAEEYIPNEVGILEYSVQHGIHREFHMFINPGYIPKGYAAEAKKLCEDYHGIEYYSPPENSEEDMTVVFDGIRKFITRSTSLHRSEGDYPPLFCAEEDIEKTRGCLKWLAYRAGESFTIRGEEIYRVWNSTYLLCELRFGTGKPLPSIFLAQELLTKTSFNYHPAARCAYHDDKDIHYCALAYSKRLSYLLSDAVCQCFDVEITERHIPPQFSDASYVIAPTNNSTRVRKSPATATPPRLDQRSNYFQNQLIEPVQPQPVATAPVIPRQPATSCLAAQLAMLKLNKNPVAADPGIGIGRGQPRRY